MGLTDFLLKQKVHHHEGNTQLCTAVDDVHSG